MVQAPKKHCTNNIDLREHKITLLNELKSIGESNVIKFCQVITSKNIISTDAVAKTGAVLKSREGVGYRLRDHKNQLLDQLFQVGANRTTGNKVKFTILQKVKLFSGQYYFDLVRSPTQYNNISSESTMHKNNVTDMAMDWMALLSLDGNFLEQMVVLVASETLNIA